MELKPRHSVHVILAVALAVLAAVAVHRARSSPAQESNPGSTVGPAQRLSESGRSRKIVDQGINLLELIDPSKDAVAGTWEKSGAVLRTPYVAWGRIQIPCIPPPEYDLLAVVTKRNGRDSFNMGLSNGERQFMVVLDGNAGTASGVDLIDSQGFAENQTTVERKLFTLDRKTTIKYVVRTEGLMVFLDDKQILEWKGGFDRLGVMPQWTVPDPCALFIGSFETEFEIQELTIVPRGGTAKVFR